MRSFLASLCATAVIAEFDDSGFMGWFNDELSEIAPEDEVKLVFEGEVPSYVKGTFVQSGPGRFGFGDVRVGHAFDGYSKITRVHFEQDGTATFSSKFLESSFLKQSIKENTVTQGICVGETVPPTRVKLGTKNVIAGHNDNNYVKTHRIGEVELVLSDTAVATRMTDDFSEYDTNIRPELLALGTPGVSWSDDITIDGHVCVMGVMAHGKVDPATGSFVAAVGCDGLAGTTVEHAYHLVFTIDPSAPRKRKLLAKVQLPHGRRSSSMHSMAHTTNHVVLIAQPLHLSIPGLLNGDPLAEGAVELGNGTIFQVVNRHDGKVRQYHYPSFQFAHVVNSWEDGEDIVMDLTWYQHDEHMNFFGQFKFENLEKEKRDAWPLGKLKRYRLRADGNVEEVTLLAEESNTMFELIKINDRKHGHEYCTWWGLQFHSYDYNVDPNSTEAGPMFASAIAKRNLCTGERLGAYNPNEYPSEVEFIPNPLSSDEDDGVLLGIVYDGNTDSSYFQVLDARTLRRLARAPLPVRVPFLVHSSFYTPNEHAPGFAQVV